MTNDTTNSFRLMIFTLGSSAFDAHTATRNLPHQIDILKEAEEEPQIPQVITSFETRNAVLPSSDYRLYHLHH
jgi:hypothetical protein